MCELSYTFHKNCGCYRIHATLPCPDAFDPSLPKCDRDDYYREQKVKGDCPDCKLAFDNKSGRQPRVKLNFTPKTPRPSRAIMQEVYQNQLKGTFDEIDQEHNQFRYLNGEAREIHDTKVFLHWLDNTDQPGPDNDDAIADSSSSSGKPSTSPSSASKPKDTPPTSRSVSPKERKRLRALRNKWARNMGRIVPSPIPTPPATMTQTLHKKVRGEYTITARLHTFDADQREGMRRLGYDDIRRFSVISRRHHNKGSSSDEYILSRRRHTLNPSQLAALRRAGRGNIRRLTVVGPRRRPPFY